MTMLFTILHLGLLTAELSHLDCSQRNSNNNVLYHQLGQTASTNRVSLARNRIRAATTDGYSGCPVFLVMGNHLVFLFSKHLGHAGVRTWTSNWGPMITHCLDMVQSRINLWEGDESEKYQLSVISSECYNPIRSDYRKIKNALFTQEE